LVFDMRAPTFGADPVDLYRAALEQSTWADDLGFDNVTLMEHHASIDGYLPSPMILGAGIAGVTKRLTLRLCLVLLPLYDPLRAAEDLAVLDVVSQGRLELTVGLGYREEEYEQFGIDIRRCSLLIEGAIETLKLAWTGRPFDYHGRRVCILPRPAQRPRPAINMGGASPASARRAARIADGYQPLADRLYEIYLEELDALKKARPTEAQRSNRGSAVYVHVADDPEREWALIERHVAHDAHEYVRWIGERQGTFTSTVDPASLRTSGWSVVWTQRSVGFRCASLLGLFCPS
jgi:alkanesulfonate monooxygenase SsuD/methylene tetrahydromethanopterin reductase-like flavin-dependent oxidoreductase (luciferase family)